MTGLSPLIGRVYRAEFRDLHGVFCLLDVLLQTHQYQAQAEYLGRDVRGLSGNRIFRALVLSGALILMGLVIFGFTGRFFAAGDSIALMRPQAGVLLVAFAAMLLFVRAKGFAVISLALAITAIGSIASGFIPSGPDCDDECLTLYQKNLLSKAWPRYSLADDILASNAEIVTLQEVSSHNQKFMSNLFDRYPHSVKCEFRPEQNVAVLTALPIVESSEFCLPGKGLAGIQVVTPGGQPVWVVSVHLSWPFPFDQFEQSKIVAEHVEKLDGPVLIAGDFNMAPWGGSVQRIRQAADNQNFGTALNTYNLGSWAIPMPIDNLLVPKGTTGTAVLRPFMGSDHLGILARFRLP